VNLVYTEQILDKDDALRIVCVIIRPVTVIEKLSLHMQETAQERETLKLELANIFQL
jgi:hypothetical protein